MKQFSNVLREYSLWLTSNRAIAQILPFHLYILFGGLGSLALYEILGQMNHYYTTLYTLGHFAFYAGAFLTLAAPIKKYLPYAIWGYVLVRLYPFNYFSLYQVIESVLYLYLGYLFFKYEATEEQS